jgi:hypothetical protein
MLTVDCTVWAISLPNHDGLEFAKPDLQSVIKKPGVYDGRSLARARTTKWKTLRCFLTPAEGVGFGGNEEVSPGPLAPGWFGAMLVEVGTFLKEPMSGSGEASAKLARQRLTWSRRCT